MRINKFKINIPDHFADLSKIVKLDVAGRRVVDNLSTSEAVSC